MMGMRLHILRYLSPASFLLVLSCITASNVMAQEEMSATPNRPGVADPAEVTQKGVLEIEYGWERAFRSPEFKSRTAVAGLMRFGLTESLELRLDMDNYVSQRSDDPEGRRSGIGETSPGLKYRLLTQDEFRPALAFSYEVKIPTASRKKGLGSGRVDHHLRFLASKELFDLELEFNYLLGWIGQEGEKGFDDLHLLALSFSRSLFGPVGISGEIYGARRLNRQTPGFASTDWAITYTLTPRMVFDAGVDIGLTSGAADIIYFAGVTLALVDFY